MKMFPWNSCMVLWREIKKMGYVGHSEWRTWHYILQYAEPNNTVNSAVIHMEDAALFAC